MRAWYGKGRYWFVVTLDDSLALGWYEFVERWVPLGYEGVDWVAEDFGEAIAFSRVPKAIRSLLRSDRPRHPAPMRWLAGDDLRARHYATGD